MTESYLSELLKIQARQLEARIAELHADLSRRIEEVRVDMDPGARMKMMEITGRRTVPQIFIGDTHVGGCDDLMALDSRGGLAPLLNG